MENKIIVTSDFLSRSKHKLFYIDDQNVEIKAILLAKNLN